MTENVKSRLKRLRKNSRRLIIAIYDVVSSYGHGNEQALETMKTIELLAQPSDNRLVINFEKFRENTPFNVLAIACYLNYYRKQI